MPSVQTNFTATPHDEAVAFLTGLPAVEREVWSGLLPELKALTFTIKLTQDADNAVKKAQAIAIMEEAKALIAQIPAGGDATKITKALAKKLEPFFPTPAQAYRRAVLLVRHWSGMARAAAWYRTLDRQRQAYPYWKYVTFGDDRVRASHAALNGKIIPASSPFWDTHFPPWAPMCRCTVVPITQAEYDRIKIAEKHLPLERRTIIEGPQLGELEKSNRLLTAHRYPQPDGSTRYGNLEGISVAPDAGWKGWNPKDLRIDFAALQERYKDRPDELRKLMERADKTQLEPGITLGHYIRGLGPGRKLTPVETGANSKIQRPKSKSPELEAKKPRTAELHSAPQPKPLPKLPPVAPASTAPADQIRAKLSLETKKPDMDRKVVEACGLISSVHSISGMQLTPVQLRKMHQLGLYDALYKSDAAKVSHPEIFDPVIYLNRKEAPNRTDIIHEFAHMIDSQAIAVRHEDLGPPAYIHHQKGWQAREKIVTTLEGTPRINEIHYSELDLLDKYYLTDRRELFARGYAQYITLRAGDKSLTDELDATRERWDGLWQWPDDEFAPMIALYDSLFRALKWIKSLTK